MPAVATRRRSRSATSATSGWPRRASAAPSTCCRRSSAKARERGLGYNQMARLTSWNPAQRFGLNRKGDIAVGFDADIALVDPARTWTIRAADSPSTQGYTPFEGLEMSARVDATFLRGMRIYEDGQVIGKPRGAIPAPADGVNPRRSMRDPGRDAGRHARGAGGDRRRGRLRADRGDRAARCGHRLPAARARRASRTARRRCRPGFIPAAGTRRAARRTV